MNYAKRIYYKIITPPRTLYRFIFRPKTFGVKCLIERDGRYLMIRNSYGKGHWTFPGGSIKRGESSEVAAIRESHEEVGVEVKNLKYLGSCKNTRNYKRDTVYCFKTEVGDVEVKIDPNEVKEFSWFARDEIPPHQSKIVNEIFQIYKT